MNSLNSLSERLKWARKQAGLTQVQLAERIGVSQNTITKIEAGGNTTHINKIAKALEVNSEWLEFGTGASNIDELDHSEDQNSIVLNVLDVYASAGFGSTSDLVEIVSQLRYVPEQYHQYFRGINPDHIQIINIKGDSMQPTFKSGDLAFVDVSTEQFDGDGVYVFTFADHLYIKRLQKAGRKLLVISDNETYEKWEISGEDEHELFIHGKVKVHQSQQLNFIG